MKKNLLKVVFLFALFAIMPCVNAKSESVTDESTLLNALNDSTVDTIVLENNIETTQKINIIRDVTIDGAGYEIKYVGTFGESSENTTWAGIYVLHAYRSNVTIKNIKLTGGNAALNVNGSKVTLVGTIDVSGNGFGGIEMGKGKNVTEYPYIDAAQAKIVNTTESKLLPTLWIDGISAEEIDKVDVDIDDDAFKGAIMVDKNGQIQFYKEKENSPTGEGYTDLLEDEDNNDNEKDNENDNQQEARKDTTISQNPNTSDNVLIYALISLVGCATLGYSVKKVVTR